MNFLFLFHFLLDLQSALTLPNTTPQKLTNQLGEGRRYKYHILQSISSFKMLKSKRKKMKFWQLEKITLLAKIRLASWHLLISMKGKETN